VGGDLGDKVIKWGLGVLVGIPLTCRLWWTIDGHH